MGFDPEDRVFDLPGVAENQLRLRLPDVVLFDEGSRPEFGAIPDLFRRNGRVATVISYIFPIIGIKFLIIGIFSCFDPSV